MRAPAYSHSIGLFVLTILFGVTLAPNRIAAQQPVANSRTSGKAWQVRLKQNDAYFLTLHAKDAPLTEIAADLSRRIKAPVLLSRTMQLQKVTYDFQNLPLETALQMMAPQSAIQYELRGNSTPICRGIFLTAYNETIPAPRLGNKNLSFVMSGDTDAADDPLKVNYANGRLSVKVKRQSLTAVLDRIASELGVSFSMKEDSPELIDLDFKEVPLENAMAYFPPSVHLHVRKDLQQAVTKPLLVEFASKMN